GWPVGHLRYRVRDGSMHMSRLAVLPAYRGQAIGRRLMEWAEQEAHRLGVLHLRGEVRSVLRRLLEWYKALGYEATGTRPLSGVPHCLTIIEKWLDEHPASARVEPDPADEQVWLEETPIAWELLHPALAELPGLRAHSPSRNSR
ncbi:MAG TPA: GNAT family N-acetyltransferase, partial [Limnochordales bacterium]